MNHTFHAAAVLMIGTATLVSAGPKFVSKWASPDARGVSFAGKKVAALVISQDESLRMSGEEALVRELTARRMQGVAAYRIVPREELRDADRARGWFERASVEGVVVLRPVSAEKERTYTSPTVWSTPYYGTLWGYYGYGWGSVYSPGSVREDTVVVVETLIYSVPQNKLLWAAASETRNPKTLQKFITDLVKEAAKEIQKLTAQRPEPATYARPELLVDTAWLAAHLDDPAVRIVDLRPRGYEDGHIPGAVHLQNAATRDPGTAPAFVPSPGDFEQSMAQLGITNATRVVAYDDRGGIYAARLWWLLNYYGHSNVALVDGGWTKWTLEGRPTSRVARASQAREAGFVARPQPRWLASASDVVAAIGKPGVKIVDARTTGEIEGRELRGARRGGIVPSSIPVYWEDAVDADTRAFKPAPVLARLYRDRGVRPEHEVIAYCQVGMRAAHDLFTLHLLGYDKLRNYLGAWDEWGNRDDLPLAAANTAKAFVGARIIDGRGKPPLENATLVVENGRVTAVGPVASTRVPTGAERIDVTGRTIVPGLVNAHGHVGDTRGLKAAPEFYTEDNLRAQLGLYARYGVTTVASLGGDREAGFALRDAQRTASFDLARLLVAGPVIAATTPEEARAEVDRVAATKPDIIKIRVDDNLGTAQKMPMPAAIAVVEQAHKHGLRAAAHIFYLDDAKALARAGVDMLAHSVRDQAVDDELIGLLKARNACVCPTLMREVSTFVYGETPGFFADPFFLRAADPRILEELRDPKRQEGVRTSRAAREYRKALDVAAANLKRLADAGVRIAFGTDTGPPARFQGYFEHEELTLMVEKAGLTPMQAIKAATADAAACLQAGRVGALEPGAWADFIVLEKNPVEDIRNTRTIASVWLAGRRLAR